MPMNAEPLDPSDVALLLDRWEAMSERYLPGRPRLVDHLLAELRSLDSDLAILDLGCGPASLLAAIATELPRASLIGIDNDPVLVALGRRNLDRFAGRADIVDSAIDPGWSVHVCANGPFDAVVAMLVLHYFPAADWPAMLEEIRSVLRPGGLLAVIDVVDEAGGEILHAADDHAGPTWTQWWDLAASIGGRAWPDAFAARAARSVPESAEHHPSLSELTSLLDRAGFDTVTVAARSGPAYLMIARTAARST